jgi:hypothetical protein
MEAHEIADHARRSCGIVSSVGQISEGYQKPCPSLRAIPCSLFDLLLVLAAVLLSTLLSLRQSRPGAAGDNQIGRLRGLRRLAFRAATVGFILTLVLIMVDLMVRSSTEG